MTENGYQGYKNYATWAVGLWLNNDEGLYRYMIDVLRKNADDYTAAKEIKNFIEENNPLLDGPASMYQDIMQSALDDVDYSEIVKLNREE